MKCICSPEIKNGRLLSMKDLVTEHMHFYGLGFELSHRHTRTLNWEGIELRAGIRHCALCDLCARQQS